MRSSKISLETAKIIDATSKASARRPNTRSSIARSPQRELLTKDENQDKLDLESTPDIEDSVPSRKRKRETKSAARTISRRSPNKTNTLTIIKKEEVSESIDAAIVSTASIKARRERKPARAIKDEETGEVEIHPPNDWKEVYDTVMEMRKTGPSQNAAVDTMGCASLAQRDITPKIKRYQTLTALMLSSQTKDTTNAVAMARLQESLPAHEPGAPVGLNLENILAVDPSLLNELIWIVGFHNNKTKYIKQTAEILRDEWNGDIPDTAAGLMSLPGVGPKMAYLCLSSAWGRTEGIGVDVHVHRITNLWGWHKTKTPEETRLALQAWLPKELWYEINWSLVGLGQTICLPVGRKCGECELGLKGLCKAADKAKVNAGRTLREQMIKEETIKEEKIENGDSLKYEKLETIKTEAADVPPA